MHILGGWQKLQKGYKFHSLAINSFYKVIEYVSRNNKRNRHSILNAVTIPFNCCQPPKKHMIIDLYSFYNISKTHL